MHAPTSGVGKKLSKSCPGCEIIHTRVDGRERPRAPESRPTEGMAGGCGSALPRIRRTGLVRNVSRIRGASHDFVSSTARHAGKGFMDNRAFHPYPEGFPDAPSEKRAPAAGTRLKISRLPKVSPL